MTIKTTAITGLTALTLAATSGMALADSDTTSNTASQNTASQSVAQSQSQGMYSAQRLIGAPVYAEGDTKDAIGEIDDVLLGNGMQIRSFVVETKGKFGILGGKSYVVSPDQLTVQTETTKKATKPDYKINLSMSRNDLGNEPVYSDSWWSNAQGQASDAWQDTKNSASSAWTKVKDTTSNIVNGTKDKADDAADSTSNAADKAGDKASDAADSASDKASNAADKASDQSDDDSNQ